MFLTLFFGFSIGTHSSIWGISPMGVRSVRQAGGTAATAACGDRGGTRRIHEKSGIRISGTVRTPKETPSSSLTTGWSKKNLAKFSDTRSVRADWLSIGCLSQWAERGREDSNMQEFFLHDPVFLMQTNEIVSFCEFLASD